MIECYSSNWKPTGGWHDWS